MSFDCQLHLAGLLVSPRKEKHIYILVISPTTKYLEIKMFYAKLSRLTKP